MMTDPYQVLGLTPNASNDDVKKAYRDLSRKYHPDTNTNNPLADLAEEKFKQVQDAYQQIMNEREHGSYQYGYGNTASSTGNGNSYQSSQDDPQLTAAANYINARHYREALNVLSGINNRNARWNYFNAVAHAGMGNNSEAMNYARQAVNMEPNNQEYNNFLNQMQWGGQRYQNNSGRYGGYGYGGSSCGTGNLCCDLWCADSLCECMGGDLCSCM